MLAALAKSVQLNDAAVVCAALLSFALGGLWYSPLLFAKVWVAESGLIAAQVQKPPLARIFGLSAIASLVMAFNLAAFIGAKASLLFGLFAGAAAGIGWVAMSLGVIYPFEQRYGQ